VRSLGALVLAWALGPTKLALPDAAAHSRGLDLRTAVLIDEVAASPRRLFSVAVAPDGRYLAAAGEEGVIRVWTLPGLREVRSIQRTGGPFYQVEFSGDGRLLLVMGAGGRSLLALSVPEGTEVFTISQVVASLHGFAPSPDGKHVAAFVDGAIRIYDLPKGIEVRAFPSADDPANVLAYSKDGRSLASAHQGTVRLWDLEKATERLSFATESRQITALAFSPDSRRLAGAEQSGTVQLWDTKEGRDLLKINVPSMGPCAMAFSPDGHALVLAARDGSLRAWETLTGREIRQLEAHTGIAYGAAFLPDGRRLVTAGSDGKIKFWASRSPASARRSAFLGVERDDTREGVVIQSVIPDSAAARAGLQAGDVIVEFGGAKIAGVRDLVEAMRRYAAGDEVILRIARAGAEKEVKTTLGAAPEDR
jgi:WD40 repeat protein